MLKEKIDKIFEPCHFNCPESSKAIIKEISQAIKEEAPIQERYWFGMHVLGGEIRYRWICKKCDYVFDIDAEHLKDMLPFVKGHVCVER